MPVSNYFNINPIMANVREINKIKKTKSVLDIGCGFGKYGFLMREFLDIRLKRYNKLEWETQIDAVEIYEEYFTPVHRHIYSMCYAQDICKFVDVIYNYDIILLSEVIEHIEYTKGFNLLKKLIDKTNQAIFIAFPPDCKLHDPKWPNPHEAHISQWNYEKLLDVDYRFVKLNNTLYTLKKIV